PVLTHLYVFVALLPPPPRSTLFPYTTLFRSRRQGAHCRVPGRAQAPAGARHRRGQALRRDPDADRAARYGQDLGRRVDRPGTQSDRKSTRLNSSHVAISYAVFCLKKKKKKKK